MKYSYEISQDHTIFKNRFRQLRGSRGWDEWFGVDWFFIFTVVVTLNNLLNDFEYHYSSVKVLYQSVFSRETEGVFQGIGSLDCGADTSEIWWTGSQAGNAGRSCCNFEAEFLLWENLVLLLKPSKWLDAVHAHYYE